jgi:hypothetical protein
MPSTMMMSQCLRLSFILSFLLLANIATPTKNGSEKAIRNVSNVSASVCVSAKAFLTMMAFVENKIEPKKVIINPAKGNAVLLEFSGIININRSAQEHKN